MRRRAWWTVAGLAVAATAAACGPSSAVRVIMQDPVAPASDAVFNAVIYTNGALAASPQTPQAWQELRSRATQLVDASAEIRRLAPPADATVWLTQVDELTASARAAQTAIDARSLQGVLDAGSRIYATCQACHAKYVPENP